MAFLARTHAVTNAKRTTPYFRMAFASASSTLSDHDTAAWMRDNGLFRTELARMASQMASQMDALRKEIAELRQKQTESDPEPVSFVAYIWYLLASVALLGFEVYFGFATHSALQTFFKVGPEKGRQILGLSAATIPEYSSALAFVFILQFATYVLGDLAGTPLLSLVYSSHSVSTQRKVWKKWSRWSFYLLVPAYNCTSLARGNVLLSGILQQIDVLFVAAAADYISDFILFRFKYMPPQVFGDASPSDTQTDDIEMEPLLLDHPFAPRPPSEEDLPPSTRGCMKSFVRFLFGSPRPSKGLAHTIPSTPSSSDETQSCGAQDLALLHAITVLPPE